MSDAAVETQRIHLARWSCTTGSNVQSRGVVVLESGDHRWEATAEGNGAVDALFGAVDAALAGVLTGHPGSSATTSMPLPRVPTLKVG